MYDEAITETPYGASGQPPPSIEFEHTIVKTLDLPLGQPWAWYADANVVGLARGLSQQQREDALTEAQAHWRRSWLRIVEDVPNTAEVVTQAKSIREVIEEL